MSVLRRLQVSRANATANLPVVSASKSSGPSVYLEVPSYGIMYLPAPRDPDVPHGDDNQDRERVDYILRGLLVVNMPPEMGRRRCKTIKVGMRSVCKLDLGPKRRGEEDVLFDRQIDFAGESGSDGIWLEEGTQMFEFNIIVPANLAPHDWHTNASIRNVLYANVEGWPSTSTSSRPLFSFRSSSSSARKAKSKSRSRSPHPTASPRGSISAGLPPPQQSASVGKDPGPLTPPYSPLESPGGFFSTPAAPAPAPDNTWLKGTYSAEQSIGVVYVPGDEAVSSLSVYLNGVAQDICVWTLRLDSDPVSGHGSRCYTHPVDDQWCVSAFLNAQIDFQSISPKATIFSVHLLLTQTTSILSPRDDPASAQPVVTKRSFPLASEGKSLPGEYNYPSRNWPALWRGTEAGGTSTGDLTVHMRGKLPTDDRGRPSTMKGCVFPCMYALWLG